ncbi:hypothetical protein WT60_14740 [Burkholderia sp. MSMB617WGS]|nr:hypothetical protein WT60_14740 [Burkholderia sp. MSMB617WGS]
MRRDLTLLDVIARTRRMTGVLRAVSRGARRADFSSSRILAAVANSNDARRQSDAGSCVARDAIRCIGAAALTVSRA